MEELRLLFSTAGTRDWEGRDGVSWSWPGSDSRLAPLPKGWDAAKQEAMLRSWAADLSWVTISRLIAAAPPGGSTVDGGGREIQQVFRDHGVSAASICRWIRGGSKSPFEWAH